MVKLNILVFSLSLLFIKSTDLTYGQLSSLRWICLVMITHNALLNSIKRLPWGFHNCLMFSWPPWSHQSLSDYHTILFHDPYFHDLPSLHLPPWHCSTCSNSSSEPPLWKPLYPMVQESGPIEGGSSKTGERKEATEVCASVEY